MQFPTLSLIDFSADYQTCYLTLSDGRTAALATTELTPSGEPCDGEGRFYIVDTETAYRDEDGTVSYDGVTAHGIFEYIDGLPDGELVRRAVEALGKASDNAWEVDGLQYDWMKKPRTGWVILAATWADAVYLTRDWHRVDRLESTDRVDRTLDDLFRSFAPAEAA